MISAALPANLEGTQPNNQRKDTLTRPRFFFFWNCTQRVFKIKSRVCSAKYILSSPRPRSHFHPLPALRCHRPQQPRRLETTFFFHSVQGKYIVKLCFRSRSLCCRLQNLFSPDLPVFSRNVNLSPSTIRRPDLHPKISPSRGICKRSLRAEANGANKILQFVLRWVKGPRQSGPPAALRSRTSHGDPTMTPGEQLSRRRGRSTLSTTIVSGSCLPCRSPWW